ncbi:MAG: type III pantothenate kinase [Myxococcales bacterium]|nr:type III pantothenate kinase [Myxococcales bacterium]
MLLALDLGNSNLVIGVYNDEQLIHSWRLETVHTRTEDEYGLMIRQLFAFAKLQPDMVRAIVLASVVPILTRTFVRLCQQVFDQPALVVGPGTKTGMPIRYDPPKDVGADRIVNAIAAYTRFKCACIIVDFGTATTIDTVLEDGTYAGGAIVPGVHVSMGALLSRAAKLPKVDFGRPERATGRNTIESIQSGTYFGHVAMVDGLVTRIRSELEATTIRVIGTGGLATTIARDATTIEVVDEHLTLEGLRLIYQRSCP